MKQIGCLGSNWGYQRCHCENLTKFACYTRTLAAWINIFHEQQIIHICKYDEIIIEKRMDTIGNAVPSYEAASTESSGAHLLAACREITISVPWEH
jgi:hypothetical protein